MCVLSWFIPFWLPSVFSVIVDSSIGDHLTLSCPSRPQACGTTCSWRGPNNLNVSSQHNHLQGVTVTFNQSQCHCLLLIQNTTLDHSGLWTCQLREDTIDRKNISRNNSEEFIEEGPYINDNQEEWKISLF